MTLLDQLKLKIKTQKTKEQTKPKESNNRPLPKILDFFTCRQENRLGILFSLRSQNHVKEPIEEESKKVEVVSYVT